MDVKAIYKIPILRHVFIVVSYIDKHCNKSKAAKKYQIGQEQFQCILDYGSKELPKESQKWSLKIISVFDFLSVLKAKSQMLMESTKVLLNNQDSFIDSELQFLCVNIFKSKEKDYYKELSFVCDSDIIEVFV